MTEPRFSKPSVADSNSIKTPLPSFRAAPPPALTSPTPPLPKGEEGIKKKLSSVFLPSLPRGERGRGSEGRRRGDPELKGNDGDRRLEIHRGVESAGMRPRPFLTLPLFVLLAPVPLRPATLGEEVEAALQTVSVAGREEPAAELILGRLRGLPASRDALGNVVLTAGSGEPRRLVACALGEPGFVVSAIRDDGYLRVVPAGDNLTGALWTQSHEGNTVVIGGAQGWRPGAVVLPSVHLQQGATPIRERPFSVEALYVDAGAEAATEVAELGIRLMDPVALIRRPARLAGNLLAGPAAALKGACVALADAARRFRAAPGKGTVVFAWTMHDRLNLAGLVHVARTRGPFAEAILLWPGFGWEDVLDGPPVPKPIPGSGSGPIGAGELPAALQTVTPAPHLPAPVAAPSGALEWGSARVGYLGLPARYPGTPVETISVSDVEAVSYALLTALGGNPAPTAPGPPLPVPPAIAEAGEGHDEAAGLLSSLIARYGVSGAEGPVREEVLRNLPSWAKPETDAKGNVTVTVGSGGLPLLFVAHMDEVGLGVEEVLADGRLRLQPRGGLLGTVWEAQAALVHGDRGDVPAVVEPREDWRTADKAARSSPLTVYLGL